MIPIVLIANKITDIYCDCDFSINRENTTLRATIKSNYGTHRLGGIDYLEALFIKLLGNSPEYPIIKYYLDGKHRTIRRFLDSNQKTVFVTEESVPMEHQFSTLQLPTNAIVIISSDHDLESLRFYKPLFEHAKWIYVDAYSNVSQLLPWREKITFKVNKNEDQALRLDWVPAEKIVTSRTKVIQYVPKDYGIDIDLAENQVFLVPTVQELDSTGAGDLFLSSLICSRLLYPAPEDQCNNFLEAILTASESVKHLGCWIPGGFNVN